MPFGADVSRVESLVDRALSGSRPTRSASRAGPEAPAWGSHRHGSSFTTLGRDIERRRRELEIEIELRRAGRPKVIDDEQNAKPKGTDMPKVRGNGTKDNPWALKTPPGTADYEAYRDKEAVQGADHVERGG